MKPRAIFAILGGTGLLFLSCPARAAVFNIANGDVAGLKSAITTSNANGQDDTIELAANGTYTITSATGTLPFVGPDGGHKLTIHGNGATLQRSSAGGTPNFRIFYIQSLASVTVSGLTIANGHLIAHGAAFYVDGESGSVSLTLSNCIVTGNFGDYGGAIYNDGFGGSATLVITDSTFTLNSSINNGGCIFNDGGGSGSAILNISNSTFSQNSNTHNGGGAIQHDGFDGSVTGSIIDCTFDQNSATGDGGAIYMDGESGSAALTILNCTFSQNSATSSGGAIFTSIGAGGSAMLQLGNSIFKTGASAQNIAGNAGTIISLGHNISNDSGSGFLTGAADQINTDPLLDPAGLQNNGGPTQTIALLSGSPAIDTGNDANAPARDQRYYQHNGVSDIGAFEVGGTLAPVMVGSSKMHGAAGFFAIDFPLTGAVGVECRTGGAGGNHQLVMPFATPVTVSGASVTSGTGTVSSFTVTGSQVTVNLTGVANAQQINVRLTNVSDGTHTNNVNIPMRFLFGDTTGNSTVNASDVSQTKSALGQTVTNSNFRRDVNANGTINASDVSIVKSQIGMSVP